MNYKNIYILIILNCVFSSSEPPVLFNYNQGTFQAFYFFKDVMIDTMKVSSNDWVGTFTCIAWDKDSTSCIKLGVCVGARKWDTTKCGGAICDLPAIGFGGESPRVTQGYMESGDYPVFLIYDQSQGVYYKTVPDGDVQLQKDICRNGYPYCYAWKNFGFIYSPSLKGKGIYMDCSGKLSGIKVIDECGVCGGKGPQYFCDINNESYCTEYEFQQKCTRSNSKSK